MSDGRYEIHVVLNLDPAKISDFVTRLTPEQAKERLTAMILGDVSGVWANMSKQLRDTLGHIVDYLAKDPKGTDTDGAWDYAMGKMKVTP